MRNHEVFKGDELIIADRILHCRLLLLIHSRLYYKEDINILSDKKWDELANELKKLQNDYPDLSNKVDWYEAFKDWDASTGAFLPLDDPWVRRKCQLIYKKDSRTSVKSQVAEIPVKKSERQLTLF